MHHETNRKRTLRRRGRSRGWLEPLEPRQLLSAADPSAQEQELLWLLNRMRTNPSAELALLLNSTDINIQQALTFFNVDKTLLQSQWAALTPVQPVGWNLALATSAAAHNDAMAAADQQGHQMPGELDPGTRISNAGYAYASAGENVYAFASTMIHAHAAFAIDWGDGPGGIQDPAGHRIDMMNPLFRDVGIAVLQKSGVNTGPYLVTQDFGQPLAPQNALLVGTVWNDANANLTYNQGEGLAGVSITARGSAGTFSTSSMTAGGYQLTLPNGSYALSVSGTSIPGGTQTFNITVNGQNLLEDINAALLSGDTTNPPPSTASPWGSIDLLSSWPSGAPRQILGWAADVDAGTNGDGILQVRLDIDGAPGPMSQASLRRPDLLSAVGSTDHGYALDIPVLSPGAHTLELFALDAPTGQPTSLGKRAVTVGQSVFGSVDKFDAAGIAGWVFDPAANNAGGDPVKFRIDVDGLPGTPTTASLARMDLVAPFGTPNHGYSLPVPATATGPHKYDLYAIGATGAAVLLASKTLTVSAPPIGSLDVASPSLIGGWAMDPDSPASPANIRIDIDGAPYRSTLTSRARADLVPFGTGAFGFELIPPAFAAGTHVITLYALDDRTGQLTLISTKSFLVVTPLNRTPMGGIDVLTPAIVAGWALDPDAQSQPASIRLLIDGAPFQISIADLDRSDLAPYFQTTLHGYVINLTALAPGSHHIELSAQDLQTSTWNLLAARDLAIA